MRRCEVELGVERSQSDLGVVCCTFAYDWRGRRTEDKRDGQGVTHRFAGQRLASTTVLERFRATYRHLPNGTTVLVDPAGGTHRIRQHGHGVVTRELAALLSE